MSWQSDPPPLLWHGADAIPNATFGPIGTPVSRWSPHLFGMAAEFIVRAEHANRLIAASGFGGKDVKINVDEVGIIGGHYCPVATLFTSNKIYWNVAASLWGYYYGELARLGTTAIAASQLTGYPAATWAGVVMPGGKTVNNNFPCVSMMDWRGNGSDTARTWALQMVRRPERALPALSLSLSFFFLRAVCYTPKLLRSHHASHRCLLSLRHDRRTSTSRSSDDRYHGKREEADLSCERHSE
jgi:hypothetical protein